MLIINENIIAEKLDREGITTNQHTIHYARILLKYYVYKGDTVEDALNKVYNKINISIDTDGYMKETLYGVLKRTSCHLGSFRVGELKFSTNELEAIRGIHNIDLEKFMFSMLSLCKAFGGVTKIKKNTFLKLSMITANNRYFDECFYDLCQLGYLDCKEQKRKSQSDTIYELVYFVGEKFPQFNEEEIVLTVHDTNTPVLYYLQYYNICDIQFCSKCGQPYIKPSHQRTGKLLCKDCQHKKKNSRAKTYAAKRRKQNQEKVDEQIP